MSAHSGISSQAEAAREVARHKDGKFGAQEPDEAAGGLDALSVVGPKYFVTRDGEQVSPSFDEERQAERWLARHQPQSVDWATQHEGYEIGSTRGPQPGDSVPASGRAQHVMSWYSDYVVGPEEDRTVARDMLLDVMSALRDDTVGYGDEDDEGFVQCLQCGAEVPEVETEAHTRANHSEAFDADAWADRVLRGYHAEVRDALAETSTTCTASMDPPFDGELTDGNAAATGRAVLDRYDQCYDHGTDLDESARDLAMDTLHHLSSAGVDPDDFMCSVADMYAEENS